jgi:hypothetical protein
MNEKASPMPDPVTEAEILLEVAKELSRVADEAIERARAALERVGRPLPEIVRLR